jgi:hypothetical protein
MQFLATQGSQIGTGTTAVWTGVNTIGGTLTNSGTLSVAANAAGGTADSAVATGIEMVSAVNTSTLTNSGTIDVSASSTAGPATANGIVVNDYAPSLVVPGVTDTFTLDADNALPTEATPMTLSWAEAEKMILSGDVQQVAQTHALAVYLTLKDGREFVTKEPSIDEVFRVVERCGEKCAGIALATE